jgi:hypothetical protein
MDEVIRLATRCQIVFGRLVHRSRSIFRTGRRGSIDRMSCFELAGRSQTFMHIK